MPSNNNQTEIGDEEGEGIGNEECSPRPSTTNTHAHMQMCNTSYEPVKPCPTPQTQVRDERNSEIDLGTVLTL